MKKIILIVFITFYSSLVFAAGSDGGGEKREKLQLSKGVKSSNKI